MSDSRADGAADPATPHASERRSIEGLLDGDERVLAWLRRRVREHAAHRFSRWAWEWIEDDFQAEILLQLSTTLRKPGFALTGPLRAYVDTSVANLCTKYFRRIARLRRSEPIAAGLGDTEDRGAISVARIALALDLRRALFALAPACRELLVEKYVVGASLQEMARTRNVEPKTIQSRLHTCRERIRALLDSRGGPTNESRGGDSIRDGGGDMNRPRNELLLGLFDCLVEVEREALERRLAASESARRTVREVERLAIEWSSDRASHPSPPALERLAGGTAPPRADAEDLAHLLECRDCAFEVSILRAGADEPRGSASGDPGRRSGRRWPLLAAAALVAATLAGVGGFRLGQRAAGAVPPTAVSVPIDLDAVRGSAESPELRLSELEVDGITVLASLRVPEGGAGWRLVREDGAVIASEALRFDPSVPRVRRVAVLVPRDRLSRGLWTFEAVAPDGAVSGRWWIRIRD